jgi:hypothetical protein
MIADFLATMFTDPRFKAISRWRWVGKVDGVIYGVVLATMSPTFYSYAVNRGDVESLRKAKADGPVNRAIVVAAKTDGLLTYTFRAARELEELEPVLARTPLRPGRFGEFWALDPTVFGLSEGWTIEEGPAL